MRRAGAVAVAAVMLLGLFGCGSDGRLRVLAPEELPADLYAPPSPTPTAAPPQAIAVFFVRDEMLVSVRREAPGPARLAEFAVRALLAGPDAEDQAAAMTTAIPQGAELLEVDVAGGVASVSLSKEFELSAEQRILVLRLGQVVYTLTDLPRVRAVRFLIDGEPVGVIGQDGSTHEQVGRSDYSTLVEGAAPATPVAPPA